MSLDRSVRQLGPVGIIVMVWLSAGCHAPEPAAVNYPAPEARAPAPSEPTPSTLQFVATAYSIDGTTASGATTRKGIVAADPKVLPLNSRIRVGGAGKYSGEYVVKDTGPAINGREIDIYLEDQNEAQRFGRRQVQVEVLEWGDGRRE